MKNLLLAIFILSLAPQANAQNAQEINVNVLQPLTFNYNTLDELSTPKTLYNALALDLKVKQVAAIVSASLTHYTFYYNVTLQPITDFVMQSSNYFVLTFTLSNP